METHISTRRDFLRTAAQMALGVSALAGAASCSRFVRPAASASRDAKGSEKPNVIFILADDIGYGDFSCYGARKIQTPHVDRLAREGRLFTDAYAPFASCTPTRYSPLTGEYAWRN